MSSVNQGHHTPENGRFVEDFYLEVAKIRRGIESINSSSNTATSPLMPSTKIMHISDSQDLKEISQHESNLTIKYREIVDELNHLKLDNFTLQQENDSLKKMNIENVAKMTDQEKKIQKAQVENDYLKKNNDQLVTEKEKISRESKSFYQYLKSLQENEKLLKQNESFLETKKKSLDTSYAQVEKDYLKKSNEILAMGKEIETLRSEKGVLFCENQKLQDEIG